MTTSADNAALARDVYDAFNRDDFDRALGYAGNEIEIEVYAQGLSFRGRDGLRAMLQHHKAPWPDGQVEVLHQLASDEGVTNECLYHATHTAPLPLPDDSALPPTNRKVQLRFCEVWRIRDGKVISLRNYADNLEIMYQLGVMPAPETTAHS